MTALKVKANLSTVRNEAGSAVPRLYAFYVGGTSEGYLAGASRDRDAAYPSYWDMSWRQEDFEIAELRNVPGDLAARLENMGTSDQDFRDGYEAGNAAERYLNDLAYTSMEESKRKQESMDEYHQVTYYYRVGQHGSAGEFPNFNAALRRAKELVKESSTEEDFDDLWYVGVEGNTEQFAIVMVREPYIDHVSSIMGDSFATQEQGREWVKAAKKCLATGKPVVGVLPVVAERKQESMNQHDRLMAKLDERCSRVREASPPTEDDIVNTPEKVSDRDMLAGYLACALWASSDKDDGPLDLDYDVSDFSSSAKSDAKMDCEAFLKAVEQAGLNFGGETDDEKIGHDFWLSRNHHGSGFFDAYGGSYVAYDDQMGKKLQKIAGKFLELYVEVGDDGKLEFIGG